MKHQYETLVNVLKDENISNTKNELIEDSVGVLIGDPIAVARLIKETGSLPVTVKDAMYASKFKAFLKGVYKSADDPIKLCEKLFSNEQTKRSNAMRVLQIIDKTENEDSLQFIVNASRAVLLGLIDVGMYYRICRAITDTLYEDLIFLQRNVFKSEPIKGEYSVHGLSRSGLMILAGIDGNADINEQKYCISNLGRAVDQFALSFEDEEHWSRHNSGKITMRDFDSGISFEPIEGDDIEALFDSRER